MTEQAHLLDTRACFLEVGVWRGGTAAVMARKLSLLNGKADFYLADTFEGVRESSDKDTFYNDGEHSDTSQQMVEKLLADKYSHYKILKGIFPEDTAGSISPDKKFGLCHIDVDVYVSAKDIVGHAVLVKLAWQYTSYEIQYNKKAITEM